MSNQLLTGNQIVNGVSPAFTVITAFSTARTLTDSDNNVYLKSGQSSGITVTMNATASQGFTCMLVNRGSAGVITLSCASGVYKNGATSTATSGTLALGGKVTLFHEGSGVWTADGSGLT
jgi:hypothetical protein